VPLNQAAVIEVRSGEGAATVADKRVELRQGTTFAVSAGEKLAVQPRGVPVELRVVQIASR
jgi:mannose-6-phosphate isomerase-like protein (cupin superfamily)